MECPNTYYFKAVYEEGDQQITYVQGEDDRSTFVDGKNAYHDIYFNPWKSLELLKRFELHPASGEGPVYSVDLTDGHFEINGISFFQHDRVKPDKHGNAVGLVLSNFRLIYYRLMHADVSVGHGGSSSTNNLDGYMLGFQANDQDGENHQHIIRI